jgi:transcriptional regulator with XRE-family HTH domain
MQDDARKRVAENVRAELARAGRTATQAAKVLGKSKQAMSPRLAGVRAFRAEEIPALAEWLGIPVATLLGTNREDVAA